MNGNLRVGMNIELESNGLDYLSSMDRLKGNVRTKQFILRQWHYLRYKAIRNIINLLSYQKLYCFNDSRINVMDSRVPKLYSGQGSLL